MRRLQFANSLVRLFIVAIAMLLASVLARWQLGYTASPHLILAAVLVTCGLYLYSVVQEPSSLPRPAGAYAAAAAKV